MENTELLYKNILKETGELIDELNESNGTEMQIKSCMTKAETCCVMLLIMNNKNFRVDGKSLKEAKSVIMDCNGRTYTVSLEMVRSQMRNDFNVYAEKMGIPLKPRPVQQKPENKTSNTKQQQKNVQKQPEKKTADVRNKKIEKPNGNQKNLKHMQNQVNRVMEATMDVYSADLLSDDDIVTTTVAKKAPENKTEIEIPLNRKDETAPVSKPVKKEVENPVHNIKEPETVEIPQIDDEIDIEKIPKKDDSIERVDVEIDDLVMDVYNVKFTDREKPDNCKVYTLIIAPVATDEDGSPVPTFVFAKSGKEICTNASAGAEHLSFQVFIDGESFIVRGRWDENGFTSFLYPQNVNNKKIMIEKKQVMPFPTKKIGHSITTLSNGVRIHVLPLASKNSGNGYAGILVCLEDRDNDEFIAASSKEKAYAEIKYNNESYIISARWENEVLKLTVNVSKIEN